MNALKELQYHMHYLKVDFNSSYGSLITSKLTGQTRDPFVYYGQLKAIRGILEHVKTQTIGM